MSLGPVGSNPEDGNKIKPVQPVSPANNPPQRDPEWQDIEQGSEGVPPSLDTASNLSSELLSSNPAQETGFADISEALKVIGIFQKGLADVSLRQETLTIENYLRIGNACSTELQNDIGRVDPASPDYVTLYINYNKSVVRLHAAMTYIAAR